MVHFTLLYSLIYRYYWVTFYRQVFLSWPKAHVWVSMIISGISYVLHMYDLVFIINSGQFRVPTVCHYRVNNHNEVSNFCNCIATKASHIMNYY